ncbi:hypothetical protein Q2941_02480 [Bradyrhizobium sp. UFLA05-153]
MHVLLQSIARFPASATAGLAAQTEMPNRTSFSEVPAASMPAFGDSGLIQIVKIGRTSRSIGESPRRQLA